MSTPLWTCDDLILACNGALFDPSLDCAPISGIEIDSRKCVDGDLFVALSGNKQDGHDFLVKAANAGATACLVSRPQNNLSTIQIVVDDTLVSLAQLGAAGRNRFGGSMIGVTGSVGKTGTKDMLSHILTNFGKTHASKRSYNNHVGVPITLSTLPPDCDFAIQEMGMNAAGEIASLSSLSLPDIAIITRIANTHSGFFETIGDIAAAKAEIFQGLKPGGIAVLNFDDPFFPQLTAAAYNAGAERIITFGRQDEAEFCLLEAHQNDTGMNVRGKVAGRELTFDMQMHGVHWAQNAFGVLACVEALGLNLELAAAHLATCRTPEGRGSRLSGHYRHCAITLIDDSYNASPASMTAAFASMKTTPPKIMILSDMLELGKATTPEHDALIPQINALSPRVVIAIGPAMQAAISCLDNGIVSIPASNTNTALEIFDTVVRDGDVVFIKGSLGSGSWRVRDAIVSKLSLHSSPDTPSNNGRSSHAA